MVFHSHLNGGGHDNDGFDAEYRVWYNFSDKAAESICEQDQDLTISSGEVRIFPDYPINGSVAEDGCTYTITSDDEHLDSIWLRFYEFNLTSMESGDALEIFDYNPSTNAESLLSRITNETFSRINWGVEFDGSSNFIVSIDSLSSLPITTMVRLFVTLLEFDPTNVCSSGSKCPKVLVKTAPSQLTVLTT